MAFSNSFHSSAKSHSIGSSGALSKVGRHNSRGYLSFYYDPDKIHANIGTPDSIPNDVARFINETFGSHVDEYNARQKRLDRMILSDAFSHFCENKKLDVAVETILQIGDMDFWERHRIEEVVLRRDKEYVLKDFPDEVKKVMDAIFTRQAEAYEKIYETDGERILGKILSHYENAQTTLAELSIADPIAYDRYLDIAKIKNVEARKKRIGELTKEDKNQYTTFSDAYFAVESIDKFRYVERIQNRQMHIKVINSTSHYDEWSPHNHVVSVCWADGYQNGLSSRVAKSMVLNRYTLEVLQEKMHEIALDEISKHPEIFGREVLKEKTRGRNFDYTTEQFIRKEQEKLLQNVSELSEDARQLESRLTTLRSIEERDKEVSEVEIGIDAMCDRIYDIDDQIQYISENVECLSEAELKNAVKELIWDWTKFFENVMQLFTKLIEKIKNIDIFEKIRNIPTEQRKADGLQSTLNKAYQNAADVGKKIEKIENKKELD